MSDHAISLILTLPPIVNKMWRPVGGKLVKRGPSDDWAKAARWEVVAQRQGSTIGGHFAAVILLPESRADIDNRIKALLDACQAGGAISNDKNCRRLLVEIDDTREGTVLIELQPISAGAPSPSGAL